MKKVLLIFLVLGISTTCFADEKEEMEWKIRALSAEKAILELKYTETIKSLTIAIEDYKVKFEKETKGK
jgi:hypothetical protein